MQPIVEDPVEDDRIPAEAGARMFPTPFEPSEIEKTKQTQNHTNELSVSPKTANFPVQWEDCLVLKDVAVSDGLKVLRMYVKSCGFELSWIH